MAAQRSATANLYAKATYLPEPDRRKKIALCLSGGGFRAALFHLGVLRRLNELDVLSRLSTITSVSGGGIAAARLAHTHGIWSTGRASDDVWEREIAASVRGFAAKNLSGVPVAAGWVFLRTNVGVNLLACGLKPITDLQ